jgi:hypothetical protein
MRYGQAISEQGVGGMTTTQGHGDVLQEDSRSDVVGKKGTMDSAHAREASGYEVEKDMDKNIGA